MGIAFAHLEVGRRYIVRFSRDVLFHAVNEYVDVTDSHVAAVLKSPPNQANEGILSEGLAAVLGYTDAMTLNVTVPDDVFAQVRKHFSEREVVEITATIAAYNCVSRFLVALDVGERNAQKGPMEGGKE
jgi:alkylhydroperoxidase family enzyme